MDYPKLESINSGTIIEKYFASHYPEFHSYITNHYPSDIKWTEKLYWYYHNINEHPKCLWCGKKLKFINFIKGYKKFCSDKCARESGYIKESREKTMIKKYGVKNPFQLKETLEKRKQTWMRKYGVDNPFASQEIKDKIKQTWIEKCSVEYAFQSNEFKEKRKQTLINKYGTDKPCLNKEIQNKYQQTCLERFGTTNPNQNPEIQEKRKQTCLKKYGCENAWQNKKTQEKRKQTCLKKYGYKTATENPNIQHKRYLTQKQNHTFNSSKIEQDFKKWLDDNGVNYKYQYRSAKYPFACDFYFPDKDLYFEIQGNWTHGFHPYNPDDENDRIIAEGWKNKHTDYYDIAHEVWTKSDPLKRETARKNGLNWVEVFSCKLDDVVDYYLSN